MSKSLFRQLLTVGMGVWLSTSALGCGPKVDGKYSDANGDTIEFKDGKATIEGLSMDYTINDKTILVKTKDGDLNFTLNDDGSIQAPQMMGGAVFKKAK